MHDPVIRGSTVVDGTGVPATRADVAIDNGCISTVGAVGGFALQPLDAEGNLVTQASSTSTPTSTDRSLGTPPSPTSSWHGVTTVVMGNCGVGFAPVAPGREDWLIGLMEGVEDIPGSDLSEGMAWLWETFPQYLDYIETLPRAIGVAAQIPDGAVRAYVVGERGAENEAASPEDIIEMARLVKEVVGPADWASPSLAPRHTLRSTASRCPAPFPPKMSCSGSGGCLATWERASSRTPTTCRPTQSTCYKV